MPALLTYREAAQRLDCSQPTLRRMVQAGTFRTVDVRRPGTERPAPRFRAEDVQRYLDELTARLTQS